MKTKACIIGNLLATVEYTLYGILSVARELDLDEEDNLYRAVEASKRVVEKAKKTAIRYEARAYVEAKKLHNE